MYLNQNVLIKTLWRELQNPGAATMTRAGKLTAPGGDQYLTREDAPQEGPSAERLPQRLVRASATALVLPGAVPHPCKRRVITPALFGPQNCGWSWWAQELRSRSLGATRSGSASSWAAWGWGSGSPPFPAPRSSRGAAPAPAPAARGAPATFLSSPGCHPRPPRGPAAARRPAGEVGTAHRSAAPATVRSSWRRRVVSTARRAHL